MNPERDQEIMEISPAVTELPEELRRAYLLYAGVDRTEEDLPI